MRHLTLTQELIPKICQFVEKGMCFKDSYLLAGINQCTGYHWRELALRDKEADKTKDESIFIKLASEMDEARARYYESLVECINIAGKKPKHWQAAMTLLERRNPEVYSRFVRLKKYDDLGLDPENDSPLELVAGILKGIIKGKISGLEGKQMSEVIGNVIKVEENSKGWDMINQLKAELKKDGK